MVNHHKINNISFNQTQTNSTKFGRFVFFLLSSPLGIGSMVVMVNNNGTWPCIIMPMIRTMRCTDMLKKRVIEKFELQPH
jgi:hypothetical protein